MTISELTLKSNDPEPARRFEVFTGSGRRREWLPEEGADRCGKLRCRRNRECGGPAICIVPAAAVRLASGRPSAFGGSAGTGIAICSGGGRSADELNAVEPLGYTRIVNGHLNSQIDDLLPWAYIRAPALRAVA